jgi:sugar phosphate isomerase/epimerase
MNKKRKFKLSFPVEIINWDGRSVSLKSDREIAAQLEQLADAGISTVMPAGLHREEPLAFDLSKAAVRIGKIIRHYGFEISSHHCLLPVFAPLAESQTRVRQIMEETVRFCNQLGAATMVFHPGRISGRHSDVLSIFAGFEHEAAAHGVTRIIETAAENLRYMAEKGAAADMRIALENVGKFEPLADIGLLPELVKTADMANIGFCVDSGHAHAFGESVPQWIKLAGNKLFETHFHDNHATLAGVTLPGAFIQSSKSSDEHLFPGSGTIPWDETVKALLEINYSGAVTFEVTVKPDADALSRYRKIIDWWRLVEAEAQKNIITG